MKQHITIEQLNELTDKAKEKLDIWWDKKYKHLWEVDEYYKHQNPLLSVGQMIEFLGDKIKDIDFYSQARHPLQTTEDFWVVYFIEAPSFKSVELCDALWQAIKEVLERE